MAIFPLFFKLFIIFFLHYVSVIFTKTGTTNKIVLHCFCLVKASLQDEWCYFKVCKKAFEWGVIKKFAMLVSYERIVIFSSNFRYSYKNV